MYGMLRRETARDLTARYPHLTVFGHRSFMGILECPRHFAHFGFKVSVARVPAGRLDRLLPERGNDHPRVKSVSAEALSALSIP